MLRFQEDPAPSDEVAFAAAPAVVDLGVSAAACTLLMRAPGDGSEGSAPSESRKRAGEEGKVVSAKELAERASSGCWYDDEAPTPPPAEGVA